MIRSLMRNSLILDFGVLKNRQFLKYCVAQTASQLGLWMSVFGMMVLLKDSVGNLMLYVVFINVPQAFLCLLAGKLADEMDKRHLLLATQSLMMGAAAVLTIAVVTGHTNALLLMSLTAISTTIGCFDRPAQSVLLFSLVSKEEGPSANALLGAFAGMTRLAGPIAGGLIVWAGLPLGWCFLFNTLSFLVPIAVLLGLHLPDHQLQHNRGTAVPSAPVLPIAGALVLQPVTIGDGLRALLADKRLSTSFLLSAFVYSLTYVGWTLAPAVTKACGGGSFTLTAQLCAYAVGAVSGYFCCTKTTPNQYARRSGLAALAAGLMVLIIGISGMPSVLVIGQVLIGFAGSYQLGSTVALVPLTVRAEVQGRAISLLWTCNFALMPLGSVVCATLTGKIGMRATLAICGAISAGAAVIYLVAMARRVALRVVKTDAGCLINNQLASRA